MFRLMSKTKRINRGTYWAIIGIAFVLSLFLHRISIVFSIAALVASMKRCRDFGMPGWVPFAFGGLMFGWLLSAVAGNLEAIKLHPDDMATALPGLFAQVGVILLLNLVFTIVIGVIPGNAGANRYGEPPAPGVGKGAQAPDYASVFTGGPGPDPYADPRGYLRHQDAATPNPAQRAPAEAARPRTMPVAPGHPLRSGFGRKGL